MKCLYPIINVLGQKIGIYVDYIRSCRLPFTRRPMSPVTIKPLQSCRLSLTDVLFYAVSALEPITANTCPLENNTLLHISLEAVNGTNSHVTALPRGGHSSIGCTETWLIVVVLTSCLLLCVTLVGIVILLCRMCRPDSGNRKPKLNPHHDWTHTQKNGVQGTHV